MVRSHCSHIQIRRERNEQVAWRLKVPSHIIYQDDKEANQLRDEKDKFFLSIQNNKDSKGIIRTLKYFEDKERQMNR